MPKPNMVINPSIEPRAPAALKLTPGQDVIPYEKLKGKFIRLCCTCLFLLSIPLMEI